jgi:hypothetical protein
MTTMVRLRLDHVVHEEDIGRDLVSMPLHMQLLECHHAQQLVLRRVVHCKHWYAEHAAAEPDVVQATRPAWPELLTLSLCHLS